MRIREIHFRDFRNFRGEHRISFVDPVTAEARQMSVIAGTNGSGKTSILDAIEGCLQEDQGKRVALDLLPESQMRLFASGVKSREYEQEECPHSPQPVYVKSLGEFKRPTRFTPAEARKAHDKDRDNYPSAKYKIVDGRFVHIPETIYSWLHFPADRHLTSHKPGAIEPPTQESPTVFRFQGNDQWQGSLEQLWVWQNYLDLEAGTESTNLKPFVETVESILGEHRKIKIEKGRVTIPVHWAKPGDPDAPRVRLDQLPSGEQQVLLLFGEIARRIKEGAVIAIDEPELSLHPTLQRLVVHQLRKLAREWDAQIILATHSLEILRAVHPSERIILDELQQPEPEPAAEAVLAE